jgi:hypothetical protein
VQVCHVGRTTVHQCVSAVCEWCLLRAPTGCQPSVEGTLQLDFSGFEGPTNAYNFRPHKK